MSGNLMDKFESAINQIRDILRKEGITGMDSIKHCLLFMFMKYLDKESCKLMDIDEKYSWDKIMESDDENKIKEKVYVKSKECLVLLLKKKNIFYVDFKLESNPNLLTILKKIQQIDIKKLALKTDIVGIIYELHLKSGTSQAMRDLGQYFTNRQVIEYMVKLTNPTIKNKKTGEIEKILDPSMGTGGFLTMAIKHLNQTHGNINWAKNKSNVYGFDIDDNVTRMSLLNTFIETGQLFDKTICKHDTLHADYMIDDKTLIDKVDVILANEPFGLKNITHAECCDRIKELKIRGTKSEPLFLQLMMLSLNEGGRAAVVVPDGVLFNDSNLHSGTRKYLVENLNLKKVVSLNGDFFLNTGVKSSIIYFVNDGITSQVEFSELVFSAGEVKENSICKVGIKDIVKADYSLFVNKYNVTEEKKIDGIKYMKLGDLCDFLPKSKKQSSYGKETGKYPFYTSSRELSKYCDDADYKDECIIIGTGGNANIKTCNNFSCSADNLIIKTKEKIVNKYLYYYLLVNINKIEDLFHGSTIKHLSKSDLEQLQIPVPSIEKQNEIVEALDVTYGQIERNNESIKAYETIKKNWVWANTHHDCEVKLFKDCVEYLPKKINIKQSEALNNGKYKFYTNGTYKNLYVNTCMYDIKAIIFGFVGNISLFIDKNFSIMDREVYAITTNYMKLEYLYYYLSSVKNKIELLSHSTTINRISKDTISEFKIKIPSKEVQEKIIKHCEYLDEQISRLKQENETLKSFNVIEMVLLGEAEKAEKSNSIDKLEETSDDDSDNSANSDNSDDEEFDEIEIKGKTYILEGTKVFVKTKAGAKGELFGTYANGKYITLDKATINKPKSKSKDVEIEV